MPQRSVPGPDVSSVPRTTSGGRPVEVRRSARRRRTVSAAWREGTAVISIPASFTQAQEAEWVTRMLAKLEHRSDPARLPDSGAAGRGSTAGGDELMARAMALSRRYLQGRARPRNIRWVGNQVTRWGSATPATGSIRLSNRLVGMPAWVIDYVILHELAHLVVPDHSPAFWRLLQEYPETETAKAFLAGAAFAGSRGLSAEMPGSAADGESGDVCGPEDDGDS